MDRYPKFMDRYPMLDSVQARVATIEFCGMSADLPVQIEEELPLIDRTIMDDWCSDLDIEDVRDLLSRVPVESKSCLAAIREAAEKGDLVTAKRAAHRLKGMAGNLGAVRLAQIARSIELKSIDVADVLARSIGLEQTLAETLERLEV